VIDRVVTTWRSARELSEAAKELIHRNLPEGAAVKEKFAAIDITPKDDRSSPHHPFLHRGDWMDDGQGNMWTVLTSLLHEDTDGGGDPYLWHEYEMVEGMRLI